MVGICAFILETWIPLNLRPLPFQYPMTTSGVFAVENVKLTWSTLCSDFCRCISHYWGVVESWISLCPSQRSEQLTKTRATPVLLVLSWGIYWFNAGDQTRYANTPPPLLLLNWANWDSGQWCNASPEKDNLIFDKHARVIIDSFHGTLYLISEFDVLH